MCGSIVGAPGRTQRVTLGVGNFGDFFAFKERVVAGAYRLELGGELTGCIAHNATATEVRDALAMLPSVARNEAGVAVRASRFDRNGLYYPVTDRVAVTNGHGFDYEVTFFGDYPAPKGEWPTLRVPKRHFGAVYGAFSDCEKFEVQGGAVLANLTAAVTTLEAPGECAAGRPHEVREGDALILTTCPSFLLLRSPVGLDCCVA